MTDMDMTDTDQTSIPTDHDAQTAPSDAEHSGVEASSLGPQSEVVVGDILSNHVPAGDAAEMHLPAESYFALDTATFTDAPTNLDHALHQLTTATDLFDVPVLDFDGHHC